MLHDPVPSMDNAALQHALAAFAGGAVDDATLRGWQDADEPAAQLAAAAACLASGRRDAARRALQRVGELAPPASALSTAAAALFFELGEFSAALELLQRVADSGAPADATAALQLQARLASMIGWHRDGIDAAERAFARDAQGAAELHRQLQDLLTREGDAAAALAHLQARARLQPPSAALAWDGAALHCELEHPDAAAQIAQALALDDSNPQARRRAARLRLDMGDFAGAAAQAEAAMQLAPDDTDALLLIGALQLWRGELEAALTTSRRAVSNPAHGAAAQRQCGAALLLLQRPAEGLAELDAAIARDPADGEAHTWRAEALLGLGRLDAARAALDAHPWRSDWPYWVPALLRGIVDLRRQQAHPGGLLTRWRRRLGRERAPFAGEPAARRRAHYELYWALHALVADADVGLATRDPRRQLAALEAARVALRGNRSRRPTAVGVDGALAYVPLRSPRNACVRALGLIKTAPPERVLRTLDDLIEAFPDSSLPHCYRGELRLWLGDYADAGADLEASIALRPTTRWAYYGLASLANVDGDPRRALRLCARSVRIIGDVGPPIHVHRGEALRRLGGSAAARQELRRACELAPMRLSGRLNLALADGDAGDHAAATAGYAWLLEQAPGLASDAAATLGVVEWSEPPQLPRDAGRALLEEMLRMMRGNRASSFATWISRRGLVRVAGATRDGPTAWQRFQADAAQRRQALRTVLERGLKAGC
ncbi:MAG: tetratricopeptide repeat protein [bacterium]